MCKRYANADVFMNTLEGAEILHGPGMLSWAKNFSRSMTRTLFKSYIIVISWNISNQRCVHIKQSEWTYHGPGVCDEVVEPEGEGVDQQLRREDSSETVVESVQCLE